MVGLEIVQIELKFSVCKQLFLSRNVFLLVILSEKKWVLLQSIIKKKLSYIKKTKQNWIYTFAL